MKTNLLLAVVMMFALTACIKNNNPRQVQYVLIPQNAGVVNGTVTFNEQVNAGTTQVDIELTNANSSSYVSHIHDGNPARYHQALFTFSPMVPLAGGKISFKQSIPITYDSAVKINGTYVLHDSTGDNVIGLCGVGINK